MEVSTEPWWTSLAHGLIALSRRDMTRAEVSRPALLPSMSGSTLSGAFAMSGPFADHPRQPLLRLGYENIGQRNVGPM